MLKRALGAITITAAVVLAAIALSPSHEAPTVPTARADPGTCAVRNSAFLGGGGNYYYVVRNRCSHGIVVKVYMPSPGRNADPGCQYVPANGYAYFVSLWVDPNWVIHNC